MKRHFQGAWPLLIVLNIMVCTLLGILIYASPVQNMLPSIIRCGNWSGVCTNVKVSEPVKMSQPVQVTVMVLADSDIPNAYIPVGGSDEQWIVTEGPHSWHVDMKAHQPISLVTTLRFTHVSLYLVTAYVLAHGIDEVGAVRVLITEDGGVVNPNFAPNLTHAYQFIFLIILIGLITGFFTDVKALIRNLELHAYYTIIFVTGLMGMIAGIFLGVNAPQNYALVLISLGLVCIVIGEMINQIPVVYDNRPDVFEANAIAYKTTKRKATWLGCLFDLLGLCLICLVFLMISLSFLPW